MLAGRPQHALEMLSEVVDLTQVILDARQDFGRRLGPGGEDGDRA